jgi:hypothetical protein
VARQAIREKLGVTFVTEGDGLGLGLVYLSALLRNTCFRILLSPHNERMRRAASNYHKTSQGKSIPTVPGVSPQ